jgi:spermidine/putrescine transport system substrate-binding protein
VSVYRARGWIEPIDEAAVPGLVRLDPKWRRDRSAATATHAFPFAWGTTGIAFRADLVREPPVSWRALFQPSRQLCGKIVAFRDARELLAAALQASGHSVNTTDPAALEQAERLLKVQHRCIAEYGKPDFANDFGLASGRVHAAMAYSSDAVLLRELNPNIRFVLPREGGMLWTDYLVVLSSSPHKPLAFEFLEFLSEPAHALRQGLYSKTGIANLAAVPLQPAAIRQDVTIYAPENAMAAAEMIANTPPAITSLRNQIVARVVRAN